MAIPGNVERYRDKSGEHRWRFRADGNDRILADSGEGYENSQDMEHALGILWPSDDAEAVAASLAILTLVTGEDWDRQKLLAQSSALRDVALHTLKKQGLTDADAQSFVDERWKTYAADIPQDRVVTTTTDPEVSAEAKSEPITAAIPEPQDMASRLAEYKAKKAQSPDPLQDPGSEVSSTTQPTS